MLEKCRIIALGGFTAMAAASVLVLSPMPSSEAQVAHIPKVCKSWISGSGQGLIQATAKQAARSNWSAKALAAHGAAYANFNMATVGAFVCNVQGAKTLCTVRARPCAYIGIKSK